jgi:hypothetical protein
LTKEQIEKLNSGELVVHLKNKFDEQILIKKKVEQWEPKDGGWIIDIGKPNPVIDIHSYPIGDMYIEQEHSGLTRETKDQAERAAKKMRTFNRLLAYVDEFDPDYQFDYHKSNHYIEYCSGVRKYFAGCTDCDYEKLGIVYMSREVAEELCRKLNRGEVCL